jgi:hypothetical protein
MVVCCNRSAQLYEETLASFYSFSGNGCACFFAAKKCGQKNSGAR